MKEEKKTLAGDMIERDEQQDILSGETRELMLAYTKRFIKDDLTAIVSYCYRWDEEFRHILPEDLVFKILGLINEGRRKCYIKSYRHFRSSVYYHVRNEILTLFSCRKKNELNKDDPENSFTISDAEKFFDEGNYANGAEDILTIFQRADLKEHLLNLFDPDKNIFEISVLGLMFDNYKRKDIAAELKLTVNEVTNIQRRVVRRLQKHINLKKLVEGDI